MTQILQKNLERGKQVAWLLSLAGLIPFTGLALLIFIFKSGHPLFETLITAFKFWSIIVLAFLGGIRWGFALTSQPYDIRSLTFSVIGSCLAFFAIFLPNILFIMVLILLYCLHGAWDNIFIHNSRLPQWFGNIRVALTFLVVLAHGIVLLAFL